MSLTKRISRPFTIKQLGGADGSFSGYGSVFDVLDSWGDVVLKGAFSRTLGDWKEKGKLPKMLWQHQSREPIGVWTKMAEDDRGLYVEGRILLEAGPVERRAYEHLKAGSVDGLSIGYSLPEGGFEYDSAKGSFLLKDIDLWEVSPVTFPANPEAEIDSVKAAIAGGPKDFERFLREAGLSRSQAKGLMARGYEGLRDLREADGDGAEASVKLVQFLEKAVRLAG